MTKRCIAAALFMLFCHSAFCQLSAPALPDSTPAIANANAQFLHVLNANKEIYTGREHMAYPPSIEGFAYYQSNNWLPGAVQYDGILYPNEILRYDLAKDLLIVQRPDGFAIELRSDKIDYFILSDHRFVTIKKEMGIQPGFYDQLASGKMTVLVKREKIFEEQMQGGAASQKFRERTTYYAGQANTFHAIRNLHSLLNDMGSKAGAVQQQLKKQGIRYRKDPEAALTAAAQYYNQMQP